MNENNLEFRRNAVSASDCISQGWNLAGANYGLLFAVAIVANLLLILIGLIPYVSTFIQPIVTGPLMIGVYLVYLKKVDNEPADFSMMFEGFSKFVPAIIVSLIAAAPWIIITVTFMAVSYAGVDVTGLGDINPQDPSFNPLSLITPLLITYAVLFTLLMIVLRITFYFPLMLLAEHDISAIDAVKISAKAGWANAFGLLILMIFQVLMLFAGALACFIGMIFVLPVLYASDLYAYRSIFPKTADQLADFSPPPPTEYEGMFAEDV